MGYLVGCYFLKLDIIDVIRYTIVNVNMLLVILDVIRIPTTVTNRSLVYFSTRLEHYERVSEGTWLSEACLWARWEYRGQLEAGDMAHYIAPWHHLVAF